MKIREDPDRITYLWEVQSGYIELVFDVPESSLWMSADVDEELTLEIAWEVANALLKWAETGKLDERK